VRFLPGMQADGRSGEFDAALHERAAVFFELLGEHDRAALERERARQARAAEAHDPGKAPMSRDDRLSERK
jgi:hypothetical protein